MKLFMLSPEQVDKLTEVLVESFNDTASELEQSRNEGPEYLGRMKERIVDLEELINIIAKAGAGVIKIE